MYNLIWIYIDLQHNCHDTVIKIIIIIFFRSDALNMFKYPVFAIKETNSTHYQTKLHTDQMKYTIQIYNVCFKLFDIHLRGKLCISIFLLQLNIRYYSLFFFLNKEKWNSSIQRITLLLCEFEKKNNNVCFKRDWCYLKKNKKPLDVILFSNRGYCAVHWKTKKNFKIHKYFISVSLFFPEKKKQARVKVSPQLSLDRPSR